MASLITNKSIPLKRRGSVYDSCVGSVMLYGAETWALTGKLEDILKCFDIQNVQIYVESEMAGQDLQ